MRRLYCTYFDAGYLSRGVVMLDSLIACDPEAHVYVLALDEGVREPLNETFGSDVTVVSHVQFEQAAGDLAELKAQRSPMEYIFSSTAAWMIYVQRLASQEGQWVTYVDADICFFGSVDAVYEDLGTSSVGIVEHRYPSWRRDLRKYGRFNVGWVSVRNDERGRACLRWWDERLREWCFDRVEGDLFADQGYLTQFPAHDWSVRVLTDPGYNVAPWNLARHQVDVKNGELTSDGRPLIFFHFHGVRRGGQRFYLSNLVPYGAWPTGVVKRRLYTPYLERLMEVEAALPTEMSPPRNSRTFSLKRAALSALTRIMGDSVRL